MLYPFDRRLQVSSTFPPCGECSLNVLKKTCRCVQQVVMLTFSSNKCTLSFIQIRYTDIRKDGGKFSLPLIINVHFRQLLLHNSFL